MEAIYKQRRLNKLFLFLFFCKTSPRISTSYAFLLSLQGMVSEPGLLYLSPLPAWSAIWWGFICSLLFQSATQTLLCKKHAGGVGKGWVHLSWGAKTPCLPQSLRSMLLADLFFSLPHKPVKLTCRQIRRALSPAF